MDVHPSNQGARDSLYRLMDSLHKMIPFFTGGMPVHWILWKGWAFLVDLNTAKINVKTLCRHHMYCVCVQRRLLRSDRWPHVIVSHYPFSNGIEWLVNICLAIGALPRWFWSKAYTCFKAQANNYSFPSSSPLRQLSPLSKNGSLSGTYVAFCTTQFEQCPRNGLGFIPFMSSAMFHVFFRQKLAKKKKCNWSRMRRSYHYSE